MDKRLYLFPTIYWEARRLALCWLFWEISFQCRQADAEKKDMDYYHKIANENRF